MTPDFADDFVRAIEHMHSDGELNYVECIVEYLGESGHEAETVASMVMQVPSILEKIELDAEKLNIIEETQRLPI